MPRLLSLDEVWNAKVCGEKSTDESLCGALPFSSQGHFLALPPIEEEVGAVSVGCVCVFMVHMK